MIGHLKYLFILCVALFSLSCSTSRDLTVKTTFLFDYADSQYLIISINAPNGDGINYLMSTEEAPSLLKCQDMDQDGTLDLIQYGNIGIDEANAIYYAGIQKAVEAGKFKNKAGDRIYEITENDSSFTIETIGSYIDQVYNRFTITDLSTNITSTFLDKDADGILDQLKAGEIDLDWAQLKYHTVVEHGITDGQIHRRNGKLMVKFSSPPASS